MDESEFGRVRADWTAYVRRMAAYGNNAIVVPLFLELITFDRVPSVYAGTDFAARHRAVRARFRELFALARRAGMGIYLATDMAALTPPLDRYLRRNGRLDATDPALWATYRAAFEEAFAELPEVQGVVVRIGEAGSLYGRAGWDYRSEFLVGSVAGLRAMLHELLPVFETRSRTLVLRSWSVGVGELGDLHTNPATYARAFDDIESPSLVISTKFQEGDFYRPLPINPTLLAGRQKRIIEFQARREFEGFAAFPNYTGALHARALNVLRKANANVVGTWIWTQNGGPLRAGPMSLYPRHGFWLWIDANAYVTSRLAVEAGRTSADLAREWVRRELTTDSTAVEALTDLLLLSPAALDRGFYIAPFAETRVRLGGFEVPPLLWIMEWNIVGGWSAVSSSIYAVAKPRLGAAVADGFAALATVDSMRSALERARPALTARPGLFEQLERSLRYEASLLDALAWYRAAFLQYYRWLDTGDPEAYQGWRRAVPEFRRRAESHRAAFADDLDFPAFHFAGALQSVDLAEQSTATRWPARVLLGLLAIVFAVGAVGHAVGGPGQSGHTPRSIARSASRALWIGARAPERLDDEALPRGALLAAPALVLAALTLAVLGMLGSAAPAIALTVPLAVAVFVSVLAAILSRRQSDSARGAAIVAVLSPLLWLAVVLLALMSIRGPGYLWYLLWTGGWIRVAVLTVAIGVPAWTLAVVVVVACRVTGRAPRVVIGGMLVAVAAVLAFLYFLAPGPDHLLPALDRPLGLVPMTHAVVIGVETYTHLPRIASWYPAIIAVLAGVGWAAAGLRGRYSR